MRIIDRVTSPGGQRANEDRLGYSNGLAWVIDGATDLQNNALLPADSDVQWLVQRVNEHLTEAGEATEQEEVEDLLRTLSSRISQELQSLHFPPDRIHPTCSIGLLRAGPDQLQLARIGDPTCLAFGADTVELSTGFFSRREAEAVGRSTSESLDREDTRRGIAERRQHYIEG